MHLILVNQKKKKRIKDFSRFYELIVYMECHADQEKLIVVMNDSSIANNNPRGLMDKLKKWLRLIN